MKHTLTNPSLSLVVFLSSCQGKSQQTVEMPPKLKGKFCVFPTAEVKRKVSTLWAGAASQKGLDLHYVICYCS